jgi:GGDEF domain-containing protein
MMLDAFTIDVLVAVVVLVSGSIFILDTLLRQEVGSGKVWAVAFLGGMLTVVCRLVAGTVPDPGIAISVGDTALVASLGCVWLGCLRFNDRPILWAGLVVVFAAIGENVITMTVGAPAGDTAGSTSLFLCAGGFTALSALESRRGALAALRNSAALTAVLAVVAAYYAVRAGVLLMDGPSGTIFTTWFNSSLTGIVAIALAIAALITATSLRSGQSRRCRALLEQPMGLTEDGLLVRASFTVMLRSILGRQRDVPQPVAVLALRVDDLSGIRIAFGSEVADAIMAACRVRAQAYAPTGALAGEVGPDAVVLAFPAGSVGEVRQLASRIQRRLLDDISRSGSVVMPLIGVGIALSEELDRDAELLIDAALSAAKRSSVSAEASVMVAE